MSSFDTFFSQLKGGAEVFTNRRARLEAKTGLKQIAKATPAGQAIQKRSLAPLGEGLQKATRELSAIEKVDGKYVFSPEKAESLVLGFTGGGPIRKAFGLSRKVPPQPLQQRINRAETEAYKERIAPTEEPVNRLIQAIKSAGKERGKLEKAYSEERSRRIGAAAKIFERQEGQSGYFQALSKLKGELAPARKQFEAVQLQEKDLNNLTNLAQAYPFHTPFEKISSQGALFKLVSGRIPSERELSLLKDVYGNELVKTILGKRTLGQKFGEGLIQAANLPRTIMASFDLSFGGRQGAFAAPTFRKQWFESWKQQFRIFGSERAYIAHRQALLNDSAFLKAKESGIAFTDVGSILSQREERFLSQWGEKVPFVRASARAYTAFANKFRLDIFKKIMADAEKAGYGFAENAETAQAAAKFINAATGRGSLGGWERAAQMLNGIFFSPRLMASRISLLNPNFYISQPPFVRKQAIKSLVSFGGLVMTILGLSKLAGADVGTDIRSSDFGKIKIRDTRIDVAAGFQQYIRMAGQLITGEYVSSVTGKKLTLGEGYKPLTRFDIIKRQVMSKENPAMSFITDLLQQQDYRGQPIDVTDAIKQRFIPMVLGDIKELADEDPELLPLAIPAFFGASLQTYTPPKKEVQKSFNR